jgi:hypothetical protein
MRSHPFLPGPEWRSIIAWWSNYLVCKEKLLAFIQGVDIPAQDNPTTLLKLLGWILIVMASLNLDSLVLQPAYVNQSFL